MDHALAQLIKDLENAPEVYRPSPFWAELAAANVRQLEENGFANFKRTINTRYFNWRILGIVRHQLLALVREWARQPNRQLFSAKFVNPSAAIDDAAASFNAPSAWIYKTFVAMFVDVLARNDRRRLIHSISEPELGNPFLIDYRGCQTSQDLCNSIHELYSILGAAGMPHDGTATAFGELGAGYGRLAYVVLKCVPDATYTIIDIPPALYLSQRYLTTLFPDLPAFTYRSFSAYGDVADEFEHARIRFLAPHQAELLPRKSFDYFVNISSLHEMTNAQVANYFTLVDALCRGRFYTKQWRVSRAQVNGCTLRERDYPVRPNWRTVFQRRHPIQRMFFEALYDIS